MAKAIDVILFGVISILGHGCNDSGNTDAKKFSGQETVKISSADSTAVIHAYERGLFEMQLAETAIKNTTADQVKRIAMKISDTYSDLNGQLSGLAMDKKILLSNNIINEEQQQEVNTIQQDERGDRYRQKAIADEKQNIELYKNYADNSTDPEIKLWFDSARSVLQKQLDIIIK